MTSINDLVAVLNVVRESLPHEAVEEYRARMDTVEQQVTAAIRTSCDETELLGTIAKAREDGTEQIQACLNRLDELITTAGSHW